MKLLWFEEPWEDYLHWQQNEVVVLGKINDLLRDISKPIQRAGQTGAS